MYDIVPASVTIEDILKLFAGIAGVIALLLVLNVVVIYLRASRITFKVDEQDFEQEIEGK